MCHRPGSFVPNASTSPRGNGWCRLSRLPKYYVDLFTRRSFWRLDPVHHYLPEPWMGLGIDCTGWPGLLGWTREQIPEPPRSGPMSSVCGLTTRYGFLSCTRR